MRLALLGGSFDPVHLGHIALAEGARHRLRVDRVLLVVAASQPLKPGGAAAPAEDRCAMLRLAVLGRPGLEVSDQELRRPGPSFTVDTLREVRAGLAPEDELLLLLGADALAELPRWRSAEEVRGLASLVACTRPGVPLPGVETPLRLEVDTPAVSSTEIRRRVAAGEAIEDLVPPEVAAYIAARGLYRD